MSRQYKLIVSDFDETLRNDEGTISEKNASAIREYVMSGGIFAICTGRMMCSILPHAQNLQLDSLLVAYQGALIQDLKSGKTLRNVHHSVADAARICLTMEAMKLHIHVYDGDTFYVNVDDGLLAMYEKVCKVKGSIVSGKMSEYIETHNIQPQKVLTMVEPAQKAEVYAALSQELGRDFYVTTSAGALVEITRKGCDKGDAIRFLSEYYRIPIENIIAIGDNINDIPMIKEAGLGVAVGNAVPELKQVADLVTVRNTENAIARIIADYGMRGE